MFNCIVCPSYYGQELLALVRAEREQQQDGRNYVVLVQPKFPQLAGKAIPTFAKQNWHNTGDTAQGSVACRFSMQGEGKSKIEKDFEKLYNKQ